MCIYLSGNSNSLSVCVFVCPAIVTVSLYVCLFSLVPSQRGSAGLFASMVKSVNQSSSCMWKRHEDNYGLVFQGGPKEWNNFFSARKSFPFLWNWLRLIHWNHATLLGVKSLKNVIKSRGERKKKRKKCVYFLANLSLFLSIFLCCLMLPMSFSRT